MEVCIIGVDIFFFQAEDGIRDLVRSRGLGDVYKRQVCESSRARMSVLISTATQRHSRFMRLLPHDRRMSCLLYTSDAADERSSVDLGGRRIIKKKKKYNIRSPRTHHNRT